MRICHFADVHCRDSQISEIGKCLGEIVQVATDEEPDLIVMAGDTFDSRMVRLDSQAAKLIFNIYGELADIAPMVVITGTPSHDGLTVQVLEHVRAENPIHVADYPEQIVLTDDGLFAPVSMNCNAKALITCIPTPTKQYWEQFGGEGKSGKETDQEVANAMGVMMADFGATASEFEIPHILVGHFSVGGAYLSETQQLIGQDIELSKDQIGYAQADLVCLGHIHLRQQIGANIFYSGSIHRKDWGEMEEKGFYVHQIDEGTTPRRFVSTFHQTPTRRLVRVKSDMTNGGPPVEEQAEGLDVTGAFVRIELKCYQDEVDALDRQSIEALFSDAEDVDLRIQPVPRETVRAATLLDLQRLRDKVREMALLREEECPESILAKADMLETMEPAELEKAVAS